MQSDHRNIREVSYNIFRDPIVWYMFIATLYAFIPFSIAEILQNRVGGLPIAYVPFLCVSFVFSLLLISKNLTLRRSYFEKSYILIIFGLLLLFFLFSTIQPFLILFFKPNNELLVSNHYLELILYVLYATTVFFPSFILLLKNGTDWLLISLKKSLYLFTLMILVAIPRYLIFDQNTSPFFNIFNPFQYRLTEVLFLVFYVSLSYAFFRITKKNRFILIHGIIIGGILFSGSRTGYLAYILFFLLNVCYSIVQSPVHKILIRWRSKRVFSRMLLLMVAMTFIITMMIFNPSIQYQLSRLNHISTLLTFDLTRISDAQTSLRRFIMLIASFEIFISNFSTGIGLGANNFISNFPVKYLSYTHAGKPHNFYLYMFVSQGISGILFIGFFVFGFIGRLNLVKTMKNKSPESILCSHLWLAGLVIIFSKLTAQFESQPFIWLFLAIVVASNTLVHHRQKIVAQE